MQTIIAALLLACSPLVAGEPLSGALRVSGNDQMAGLLKRWEEGFRKIHPNVRIEAWLKGSGSGMYGLEMRTSDIALMGRPIHPYERYGVYERAWVYPVEIEVATGSFAVPHKSPAYAVFVHKDNPLARLTVKQLDGIFGAERGGGWKALTWDETAAHTKDENIRTWGQLGLTGEWAGKPIRVYGPPNLGAGTITYFQAKVMGGGAIFNEDLREYADRARMIADLGNDRYGIAYTALGYRKGDVKPVALADTNAGPFVELTRDSVADRSYPLARPVYIYYTIDNEKTEIANPRVDPKVRKFLRYVLSKQGQQAVAAEGAYLPLRPAIVEAQLQKLDFSGIPPERRLVTGETLTRVRMSIDEDPVVIRLAASLGYLRQEGIEIVPVDLEKLVPHDYLMQEPLTKGQVDAAYHWFSHTIYGARHGFPIKAVMVFNDAPGMKVMVANRVKGEIRSAGDFRGKRIAEGAGYGTKSVINGYMARRAGLPASSYTPVMLEKKGREQAVLQGLKDGIVDVMTFEEPISSNLLATNLATTLYDMSNGKSTAKVLGAPFPAQSLLMSPAYIEAHPETVQRLVNAFVRTMRFINSHDEEEIAARLPPDYFAGKDRAAEVKLIRDTLPTYARDSYALLPDAVKLSMDINLSSGFDRSEEGQWRATGDKSKVRPADLYTNRFVDKAMKEIK